MSIRMGYWDCSSCGQKRINGPERQCPGCGRPRNPEVSFYTTDDAPTVEAPEQLARARAGADWACPYCGADNPKGQVQCVGCGATSEGSKSRAVKEILDAPPPATAKKASGGRAKVVAGVLVVLAVLFAAIYVLCIQTKPLTVTVERAVWVKALHIERLDTERKEAWHEQVPSGARELRRYTDHRSKRVQVGTEKVKTGKKDLGNGYFEDIYTERPKYEDREVEDTKVVYEIDRWVQDRTIKNESSDGREPDFPQFLSTPRSRIGRRESAIALELAGDNKKSYHYDVDLEAHPAEKGRVLAYGKGKSFTAFVNVLGVVTRLEPR